MLNLIARLFRLLRGMDAAYEEDSERDGAFSYAAEWHAFSIGFYEGLKDFKAFDGLDAQAQQNKDVKAEPHYARGGYVVGSFLRVAIYLLLGYSAAGVLS